MIISFILYVIAVPVVTRTEILVTCLSYTEYTIIVSSILELKLYVYKNNTDY